MPAKIRRAKNRSPEAGRLLSSVARRTKSPDTVQLAHAPHQFGCRSGAKIVVIRAVGGIHDRKHHYGRIHRPQQQPTPHAADRQDYESSQRQLPRAGSCQAPQPIPDPALRFTRRRHYGRRLRGFLEILDHVAHCPIPQGRLRLQAAQYGALPGGGQSLGPRPAEAVSPRAFGNTRTGRTRRDRRGNASPSRRSAARASRYRRPHSACRPAAARAPRNKAGPRNSTWDSNSSGFPSTGFASPKSITTARTPPPSSGTTMMFDGLRSR